MFFSGQKSNNPAAFQEALAAIKEQVQQISGKLPSICLQFTRDLKNELQPALQANTPRL